MELNDVIYGRASVRAFTDEPPADDRIERLLRAAMAAPSAGNQQPWAFVVVRDAGLRARLAAASPYAGPAEKAPVVVVVCTRPAEARFPGNAPQDAAAATENLLLAAVDEGLGAVWLGIAPEEDRMAAVAAALDLPADTQPFALVAVGFPAAAPAPRGAERFDPERVQWR